ncbi:hypothetical protein EZS27_012734 [termite gut metagenome]|uniref:CBM6 domain-containing protein n=1 Tax=termite gut metagenome TaxID=433724 RepID=A0A5J4RZK1_9ZZZZ
MEKKINLFKFVLFLSAICVFVFHGCAPEKEYDYEKLLYLNQKSLNLFFGDTIGVKASPSDATVWTSEDQSVAIVSANGLVEAKGVGETFIVATQGEIKKRLPVKVTIPVVDDSAIRTWHNRAGIELRIDSERIKAVHVVSEDGSLTAQIDVDYLPGTYSAYFGDLSDRRYVFNVICIDRYDNEAVPIELSVIVKSLNVAQRISTAFGNGLLCGWNEIGDEVEFNFTKKEGTPGSLIVPVSAGGYTYAFSTEIDYSKPITFSSLWEPQLGATESIRSEVQPLTLNNTLTHFLSSTASGVISGKEFDMGGDGVGFHDSDTNNQGGTYRGSIGDTQSEGCDVEGGGNIGFTTAGEWVMYTVDVLDEGDYEGDYYISVNGTGAKCHFEIDGDASSSVTELANNSNWSDWRYYFEKQGITPPVFHLTKGIHKIKFAFDSGNFNYNGIRFRWKQP